MCFSSVVGTVGATGWDSRVFLLRKVHGLKQREIADTLGISVRMVEKHLKLGTLKCRDYVNEQQAEEEPETRMLPTEGLEQ